MAVKSKVDQGEIRTLANRRGRTIANTNTEGLVAWENAKILESVGLTLNDVQLVGMAAPDMPTALANSAVDVALLIEPFCVVARRLSAGVALVAREMGSTNSLVSMFQLESSSFPPSCCKTALALAWLRAHLQAARLYNEALGSPSG